MSLEASSSPVPVSVASSPAPFVKENDIVSFSQFSAEEITFVTSVQCTMYIGYNLTRC